MEFIYAKLNKQLEKSVYKGGKSSTILVSVDNKEQIIQADITAVKLYLHRIKLNLINDEDNAIIYLDYYSRNKEPFNDCVFTHMTNINDYLPANGSYNEHFITSLSIIPNGDDYDFIINNGEKVFHSQDGYMRNWTIEDKVEGYLLKE